MTWETEKIFPKTHFVLGKVGAPFALDGFVKVKPFSGETGHFSRIEKVILRQNGKETERAVAETIPRGDFLLMRFEGINSPEAAEVLKGAQIVVGREYAAPLKEGEYYVEDLKGLALFSQNGQALGQISDIVEGGGGQLAEILLSDGKKKLVPFRKEFFGSLSLEEGKIVLLEPWILD